MKRFSRINGEFRAFVLQTLYIHIIAVIALTLFNLWGFGFFSGYLIQRGDDDFLDQVEFENSNWFEVVSENFTPVDGRFSLCEPFALWNAQGSAHIIATPVEGRNAPCEEYGLATVLGPGRWQFLSQSGATPKAQIWSQDTIKVHRELPMPYKVFTPIIMLVMTLAIFIATGYFMIAVKEW